MVVVGGCVVLVVGFLVVAVAVVVVVFVVVALSLSLVGVVLVVFFPRSFVTGRLLWVASGRSRLLWSPLAVALVSFGISKMMKCAKSEFW